MYAPCGQSLCPGVDFAPTATERDCTCGATPPAHQSCGCGGVTPRLVDRLPAGGKNSATGVTEMSRPSLNDPSVAALREALAQPEPQLATAVDKTVRAAAGCVRQRSR